jgi:ribosomal 50S subunit-recycling heat shock protein
MCERSKVLVNNQVAKPAKDVKPGDQVTLLFTTKRIELEVLDLVTSTRKADAALLYRVITEQRIEPEESLWTKNPL